MKEFVFKLYKFSELNKKAQNYAYNSVGKSRFTYFCNWWHHLVKEYNDLHGTTLVINHSDEQGSPYVFGGDDVHNNTSFKKYIFKRAKQEEAFERVKINLDKDGEIFFENGKTLSGYDMYLLKKSV